MPIRIQLLPDYVHVNWHGELTTQDLDLLSVEMPRIGWQIGHAPNVLHTFDETTGSALRYDAMHSYGRNLQQVKLPNPCRVASVCNHTIGFGLARMMQLINQNPDLDMKVFSEKEAALCWLTETPKKPE
ncbi:MAG: hypothetical protein QG602_4112 [Verrucomicrobiota bacterium]|nr:hypothetical protein [Verrucomicrobiota bacterium]